MALTPEDIRSLQTIQSTREIHLSTFVPQGQLDPLYLETPYFLYPDGENAIEPFQVIATAMAESGRAGLGRVAIQRREHIALMQPRGAGLVLFTLRAADEVLIAEFPAASDDLDPEMVELAMAIIDRRSSEFDPAALRDPHTEALRQLAEAKASGEPIAPKPAPGPSPVADLMQVLRRSLEDDGGEPTTKPKRKPAPDRRQRNLFLPVQGKSAKQPTPRRAEKRSRSRGTG